MAPSQLGKWLVLFCDEINLPDLDQYGEDMGLCMYVKQSSFLVLALSQVPRE